MILVLLLAAAFTLGSSLDEFERDCLRATNQLRRRHGVPDLNWSPVLAANARAWAAMLAKTNRFEHDYNSIQERDQGENLAYFKPYKEKCQGPKRDDCVQCREIVADWYSEVKNYDFGMGKPKTPGGVVLHFTQEVWKNSRQFGIGTARGEKYGFIAVARYSPRGNKGGPINFKDNVFAPGAISDLQTTPTMAVTTPGPEETTGSPTTPAPGAIPTPLPSATSPTTPPPEPIATTLPPTPPKPAPGPALNASSKCEYFVVNSTTYTFAIVQKCPGKPNVTLVPKPTEGKPTTAASNVTTGKPTTAASNVTTGNATTAAPNVTTVPPTTKPPDPCTPNPCKNGGKCEPKGENFTCACPEGYTGPLCEERGPSAEEIKDALMLTNMYRARHSAPEVTWNKELAGKAQDWADKLAKEQRLVHEDEAATDYGENLAELATDKKGLLRAIDAWYDEVLGYNFKEPKFSEDTGHFTQLVWSATNEIGMGKATTKDKLKEYVVARYKPAGNVVNQFAQNVNPLQP